MSDSLSEQIPRPIETYTAIGEELQSIGKRLTVALGFESPAARRTGLEAITQEAKALETKYVDFVHGKPIEQLNTLYANRGEIYVGIKRVVFEALGTTFFDALDDQEKDDYIDALCVVHGERLYKKEGGYYHFSFGRVYFEIPEERKLLKEIGEDPTRLLTPGQENKIYNSEANEFKIHISVPPELRIEVLKKLIDVLGEDNGIVRQIFKEKETRGEPVQASREEIDEKGGKLTMLSQWKMKTFGPASEIARHADFVVYVTPSSGESSMVAIGKTISQLAEVLTEFNLPKPIELPRYSKPVLINGQEVNSLSLCQGNGDFKDYLLRTGGEEKLARFYNPARNFALRQGMNIF